MIPNQQETKKQLLVLLENEFGQEQIDGMVFAIQQRVEAYNGHSISAPEIKKIIHGVYKERTQALWKSSLPPLKRLSELLRQRRWENPGVIELKKK